MWSFLTARVGARPGHFSELDSAIRTAIDRITHELALRSSRYALRCILVGPVDVGGFSMSPCPIDYAHLYGIDIAL